MNRGFEVKRVGEINPIWQLGNEYSILNQPDSELNPVKQLVSGALRQDNPSIGILLVPHKDKLEVEYALRTSSKPIGVAQYTLSKKLR